MIKINRLSMKLVSYKISYSIHCNLCHAKHYKLHEQKSSCVLPEINIIKILVKACDFTLAS